MEPLQVLSVVAGRRLDGQATAAVPMDDVFNNRTALGERDAGIRVLDERRFARGVAGHCFEGIWREHRRPGVMNDLVGNVKFFAEENDPLRLRNTEVMYCEDHVWG